MSERQPTRPLALQSGAKHILINGQEDIALDALDKVVADVRRYLLLHRRTGVSYIRINSNQGGITAADFRLEEKP